MRRQFALPEFDLQYLASTNLEWETLVAGAQWLLLRNWVVRPGYNVERVTVALQIPAGYPDTQIDMAYFHPHLARQDGKPIAALAAEDIGGASFQRWSRHRTAESPWRPGEDDVSTHLVLVDDWLERELAKP
jgi:Prokaryotic E2 family E